MTLHDLMEQLEAIRQKYGNPEVCTDKGELVEVKKIPDKIILVVKP